MKIDGSEFEWDENWIRRKAWDLSRDFLGLRLDLGKNSIAGSEELIAFLHKPAAEPMPLDLLKEVVAFIEADGLGDEIPSSVLQRLEQEREKND